jgi:hypothetical protein
MSTWNFRLLDVADENGGDPYLTLVEAHYNDAGVPVGYCDPCTGSDTVEGMKQLIEWYALALAKPVMKKGDFIGEFEDGNITAGDQEEESHE